MLEHIKTARPVASQDLLRSGFKVSPATLRNEMLALDELGLLEQPHTSSGRVPTDRGYRFFVDNLLSEMYLTSKDEELLTRAFAINEVDDFVKEFTRAIAGIADTFTAVGVLGEDHRYRSRARYGAGLFYEAGFAKLLDEPELYDIEQARMFGRLADLLDESVRDMFDDSEFEDKVFIGRENPLKEAGEFSMFVSSWHHPGGFQGFVTMVGPRRTNYPKHNALIKSIRKISENYDE